MSEWSTRLPPTLRSCGTMTAMSLQKVAAVGRAPAPPAVPVGTENPRRARRLAWLYEVAIIAVGYAFYSWIRNLVTAREGEAVHRAQRLVELEKTLGIYHERAVNHFVAGHHWLAYASNYYYATMHFAVTIAAGVWIYRRHPEYARPLRSAWYAMNVAGLFGFAFLALAPPRLLPGGRFVDTVVEFHTWGSWGDQSVSSHSNQYAAMPSMHIGWSAWVGLAVVALATRRGVRLIGALYPFVTLFVIIGTGNHFFLDAVGGLVALGAGFLVVRVVSCRRVLPPLRKPARPAAD